MMNKGLKAPMFEGPVYCSLIFVYKSTKKKLIGLPKDTKSDCDNIAKLLIDVLGDMNFFKVGDQQITDLQISKFWGLSRRSMFVLSLFLFLLTMTALREPSHYWTVSFYNRTVNRRR